MTNKMNDLLIGTIIPMILKRIWDSIPDENPQLVYFNIESIKIEAETLLCEHCCDSNEFGAYMDKLEECAKVAEKMTHNIHKCIVLNRAQMTIRGYLFFDNFRIEKNCATHIFCQNCGRNSCVESSNPKDYICEYCLSKKCEFVEELFTLMSY